MGDVSQVIVGSGLLYLGALGITLPTPPAAPDWSGFVGTGFSDKGIELDYTPTFKDIMVDEELAPVQKILTAEKLIVHVDLAETSLQNLVYAIAGATLTNGVLNLGSADTTPEYVLGFQGPAPPAAGSPLGTPNKTRAILMYRVKSIAGVKMHYQRKDKVMFTTQFEALPDSGRADGSALCAVWDF